MFSGTPPSPWPVFLALGSLAAVAWAARRRRYALALVLLVGGIGAAWAVAHPSISGPSFHLPGFAFPSTHAFAVAFFLLVIPQLPLTFGNAVVAVNDLAHEYFGEAARLVRPSRVCVSCAAGNVASALIGGMPMCHGAGGLTAHVRLGARTAGMNLLLGSSLIGLGLFFAPQVPVILGLLPVWALAAFLAYAGIRHALLVADLRGYDLAVAAVTGAIGAYLGNLAITAAMALVAVHSIRLVPIFKRRRAEA
jgi:SulP family sulfate permease